MAGEEWARRILEKALQKQVVHHDDGSRSAMYDLRIGPIEAPIDAIECVGAVNPELTETWNIGPARGPLLLPISGDWHITITPNAKIKAIRNQLAPLLIKAELQGWLHLRVDHYLKRQDIAYYTALTTLGIKYASCYRLPGTGKIYMGMDGMGGAIDTEGTTIPTWLSQFLRDPKRQDVLSKLQRSEALKRHVFIIVAWGGATWSVESYLTGKLEHLPSITPDLPQSVTDVWIISTFGQQGLRWEGTAWQRFEGRGDAIDI